MTPCDECGALCPNSSWTIQDDLDEIDYQLARFQEFQKRSTSRIVRYAAWRRRQDEDH